MTALRLLLDVVSMLLAIALGAPLIFYAAALGAEWAVRSADALGFGSQLKLAVYSGGTAGSAAALGLTFVAVRSVRRLFRRVWRIS
jgi:hypothetical protein